MLRVQLLLLLHLGLNLLVMALYVLQPIDLSDNILCATFPLGEFLFLLPDGLVYDLQLQFAVHLLEHGRLCVDHFCMPLAIGRLVYLLGEEPSCFSKLHNLLLVQLHEALVALSEAVARHLAEAEAGGCLRVLADGRLLVQAEAILAEDELAVVLLEARQFVLGLHWSPVVHRFGHFLLLGSLVLLREV